MERVSPVFDVAKHLLLVDIDHSTEVARCNKTINETELVTRASHVADLGVEVLICGAISKPLKMILEAKGIEVVGQVCGNVEEVMQAFLKGALNNQLFLMPGCKLERQEFQAISTGSRKESKPKEPHMRVAVTSQGPDLKSQVDPRFGRAKYLIVVDADSEEYTALDNSRNLNAVQGAGIQTVRDVVSEKVDAVLTGQVGPKALQALETARVQVYVGASGTVEEALRELRSGRLKSSSKSIVA